MSAFMVSNTTIDRVLQGIHMMAQDNCLPYSADLMGYDFDNPDELSRLGRDLWAMNIDALCDRYGPDERIQYGFASEYVYPGIYHTTPRITKGGCLKALRCLLYQCSEGDVDGRVLFKCVETIGHAMTLQIAEALPDYESAPWDFDARSYSQQPAA